MTEIGWDQRPRDSGPPSGPATLDVGRLCGEAFRRLAYALIAWPVIVLVLLLASVPWVAHGIALVATMLVAVGGVTAVAFTASGRRLAAKAWSAQRAHARRVNAFRKSRPLGMALGLHDRHGNGRRVRVRHAPDGSIASLDVDARGIGADAVGRQLGVWASTLGLAPGASLAVRPGADHGRVVVEVVAPVAPLPACVRGLPLTDAGGAFVLGVREGGEPLVWDPRRSPHCLLSGSTGSGKTVTITGIISSALAADYWVWIGDHYKGTYEGWASCLGVRHAIDKSDIAALCAEAVEEMQDRYERWRPNRQVRFVPLLLILDEAADLLDGDSGRSESAKADQALVSDIRKSITTIARLGREVRVHLLVAPQRGDAALLGGQLRDQLTYRILQLGNARESTINMALELSRDSHVPGREPPIRIRDLPAPPGRVLVEIDGGAVVVAQIAVR